MSEAMSSLSFVSISCAAASGMDGRGASGHRSCVQSLRKEWFLHLGEISSSIYCSNSVSVKTLPVLSFLPLLTMKYHFDTFEKCKYCVILMYLLLLLSSDSDAVLKKVVYLQVQVLIGCHENSK